ncbi:MAG: prepilin-type N-terminal cleavage/methylation domain-containing protein [Planctomycetia bacterium]|nr:prepilin-type N-terminal cleavage/methylation domain-containing protein [Planctomycetia bacterium]
MKNSILHKRNSISVRRGMTLIELLVVSAIMLTLMAVSVPVLTPIAETRVARETARGVQSALESARARAIQLGRPCGVALMPFHSDFKFGCITMEQLTAPPSYLGKCSASGGNVNVSDLPIALKRGDSVQVNGVGARLSVSGTTPNVGAGFDQVYDFTGYGTDANDCLIHYFPVSESGNAFAKALGIETSYMLPKGYIVDLYYSGVGVNGTTWRDSIQNLRYPPTIIFNPDGSALLYLNGTLQSLDNMEDPKIYLLVGSWSRMRDSSGTSIAEEGDPIQSNDQDYNAFWVVVNPKTGLVTSARNLDQSRISAVSQSSTRGGN